MSKKDFDNFINKQAELKAAEKPINWNVQRDEWLEYLSQFYNKIEKFLAEYLTAGKVVYNYSEIKMFEEYIGSYSAWVLNIELGSHKVKLEPIGTNLIGGTKGRVDLIGANGKIKFVLVNKNSSGPKIKVDIWIEGEKSPEKKDKPMVIEWNWKISTPPPRIQYINFEQDTFLEAIMEVVGG